MTTIGDTWRQQVNFVTSPSNQDISPLCAAIQKDEAGAYSFFNELRYAKLVSYTTVAAKNQKHMITLEAPGFVLGTDAFAEFLNWAKVSTLMSASVA